MMTRKNQVDDLLARFERKSISQKKCPYCTFDPDTHMGADFISGSQIDQTFKEQIDRWDGTNWTTVTYIYEHKDYFELVTNNPDSECYSRVLTYTTIEYCPKCRRRLLSENSTN